jgi:hypothetical protein
MAGAPEMGRSCLDLLIAGYRDAGTPMTALVPTYRSLGPAHLLSISLGISTDAQTARCERLSWEIVAAMAGRVDSDGLESYAGCLNSSFALAGRR